MNFDEWVVWNIHLATLDNIFRVVESQMILLFVVF